MAAQKKPSRKAAEQSAPAPSQTVAGRLVVGFLAAAMFLVGVVVLALLGAFAYQQGVPMVGVAVLAVALLAGVFALLRRWADS